MISNTVMLKDLVGFRIVTITVALVLTIACAAKTMHFDVRQGDYYAFTHGQLDRFIIDKMDEHEVVGLSIALVDDQKVIWAKGYGFENKAQGIKATASTGYRVGSISKLFTATAIMQLAEQGKLNIDDPLVKHLPEFKIKTRESKLTDITLRSILTHHSGLPEDVLNSSIGIDDADFRNYARSVQDDYVAYPPNTLLTYSNLGFTLLGHVVENVSQMPFEEYVQSRILQPIGMENAYFSYRPKDNTVSKGYMNGKETTLPSMTVMPAGGLNASALELAKFAQMTFNQGMAHGIHILKPETLDLMQRYQDGGAPFDFQNQIGLGWFIKDDFGAEAGPTVWHNGGMPMFMSQLITLPKQKLAVVVLTNTNTAGKAAGEIARKTLELALESKTGIKKIQKVETLSSKPLVPSTTDIVNYQGKWASDFGPIVIRNEGEDLVLELPDTDLDFELREDGNYYINYRLLGLFSLDLGGLEKIGFKFKHVHGRDLLIAHQDGEIKGVFAEKIRPQPLTASWKRYLGRYETVNTKGMLEISNVKLDYIDGNLSIYGKMGFKGALEGGREILLISSDNEAIIAGLGRGKGETMRIEQDQDSIYLHYSGFIFKKID